MSIWESNLHWEEIPVLALNCVASTIMFWTLGSGTWEISILRADVLQTKKNKRCEWVDYSCECLFFFFIGPGMLLTLRRNTSFIIELCSIKYCVWNFGIRNLGNINFTSSCITKKKCANEWPTVVSAFFFFMGQSCNLLHWEEIPLLSLKWVASSIVGWTSESGMLRFSISRPASKKKNGGGNLWHTVLSMYVGFGWSCHLHIEEIGLLALTWGTCCMFSSIFLLQTFLFKSSRAALLQNRTNYGGN